VTEAVLDASVVMKWFRETGERHVGPARSLRTKFETGNLVVFAPPLLGLEIVNVAGHRWQWAENDLLELATAIDDLGFELIEPELPRVAHWTARGLTAYDAAYVTVAEASQTRLITDDDLIVQLAGELTTALAETEGWSR
jgi:predicted nucleic acid-binding protein